MFRGRSAGKIKGFPRMTLKRHHKWMIGSFTTIVIIYMIISGILLNGIIVKQTINHNELKNKVDELQADTQGKLNELTENLLKTKQEMNSLNNQLGSMNEEFELLKSSTSADFSGIIDNSVKAVVTIRTDVSQGTGFIIRNDGYVVTNAHVLSGGTYIEALNYEQQKIPAALVGYNAELDIALLKIEGDYEMLELSDSDEVQVGEKVIAIGNALGLQFSASEGIVSGTHRLGPSGQEIYIQTDAALNAGNSGGPLINKEGKVIGINTFKIIEGESMGFALESNYIKEMVNQISREVLGENIIG